MARLIGLFVVLGLLGFSSAQNAIIGDFPSHVALSINPGNRFGEGVILNERFLLTLAENVVDPVTQYRLDPALIFVTAGVVTIPNPLTNPLLIDRIYVHEEYNFHTGKNNVAVLRLVLPLQFDVTSARPAIFPVRHHVRILVDGTSCNFVGWNAAPNTLTTPLQNSQMTIMNRNTCNNLDNAVIRGNVRDQHICAGTAAANPAVCNNNNGAGLYCGGNLVGLRAFGRQCNVANSPAVVVQTRWFIDWIERQFLRTDLTPPGPLDPPGTDVAQQPQVAALGDFPAHVGLVITGGRFGEGVVVNQNHVLTVAENVFEVEHRNVRLAPNAISVASGLVTIPATPTNLMAVQRIYAHNDYNFHSGKFNVAVLRTNNNFVFPAPVPRPSLAVVEHHNRIVPEGSVCHLVGFRRNAANANILQSVAMPVFDRQECTNVNNGDIRGMVREQDICIGGATQTTNCDFNNGAAFYCHGELVGLRTNGLACAGNSPGIVIQSRWFLPWINQQFQRTDETPAGVVSPPGAPEDGGASSVILSTVALAVALMVTLLA